MRFPGGQRQRIAIARAIFEGSSYFDSRRSYIGIGYGNDEIVQSALETLMKGRTSLVIAHRLSTVRNADKIVVINHGSIVESGTHKELLARDGLYASLYAVQFNPEVVTEG